MNVWKLSAGVMACCVVMAGVVIAAEPPAAPSAPDAKKAVESGKKAADALKDKAKDAAHGAMNEPGKAAPGGMTADQAKAMEAWEKAATPGEMHKQFEKQVGMWNVDTEILEPGMESKGKGTAECKTMWEGRYCQMTFKGDMMGMSFEGLGTTGYNNTTKKFESTWIDSMSTQTMMSTGTMENGVVVMRGEFVDPADMKTVKTRETTTWKSDNQFVMEFYHERNGKDMKVMVLTFNRAGAAKAEAGHGGDMTK